MKIYRVWKHLLLPLTMLLLAFSFGTTAFAYERIDTEQEASLTVYFGQDGDGFSGVEFQIYRVADVSALAQFTLTGDFAGYPVQVNGLDSSGWRALAQTLDGYVARDGLEPLQTARTGRDGSAAFDGLSAGLYLVTGDRYREGRYTYTPEPFLICLPTLDEETDAWIYDVTASCKYDSRYNPPGGGGGDDGEADTIVREVLKVWEDDGNEEQRPDEIVVQLLRDGRVYDTVTLNERNNWKYTWFGLDADYQWRVVEYETPEGYTVSVYRQGITFVMTNSWTEDLPDEETPEDDVPPSPDENPPDEQTPESDVPPSSDENLPDGQTPEGDVPSKGDEPGSSGTQTLPKTGVLWWPVPVLACAGLFLFLIGWGKHRHERS